MEASWFCSMRTSRSDQQVDHLTAAALLSPSHQRTIAATHSCLRCIDSILSLLVLCFYFFFLNCASCLAIPYYIITARKLVTSMRLLVLLVLLLLPDLLMLNQYQQQKNAQRKKNSPECSTTKELKQKVAQRTKQRHEYLEAASWAAVAAEAASTQHISTRLAK